jgi:surface polysaccharide O-acyltransferase-like enzyme
MDERPAIPSPEAQGYSALRLQLFRIAAVPAFFVISGYPTVEMLRWRRVAAKVVWRTR